MSRDTKIILAIVAGLLLVGICVCVVAVLMLRSAGEKIGEMVKTDPTQVAQVAAGIAQYDIPSGYSQMAMDFMGIYKAIIMAKKDTTDSPMIMMMSLPSSTGLNTEDMQKSMERSLQQRTGSGSIEWQVVEEKTVKIRGEDAQLAISEGASSTGERYRSLISVFSGVHGPAILMIMGSEQSWDQTMIDAFISSIR
ncbi:MAG: hypothetical protein AB1894_20070 [Chloroflexota bacterium]